jgi:hypothetical protein
VLGQFCKQFGSRDCNSSATVLLIPRIFTTGKINFDKGKWNLYFKILNKVNNLDLLTDLRLKGLVFIKFSAGCPQNISKFSFCYW